MCGPDGSTGLSECDDDDECEQGCDGEWYSDIDNMPMVDDCGVCNGGNADQDCNGDCFGGAVIDDCGVCDGPGGTIECWDGSLVCDSVDCSAEIVETPELFEFSQSTLQAFYLFEEALDIDGMMLEAEDFVAIFNGCLLYTSPSPRD